MATRDAAAWLQEHGIGAAIERAVATLVLMNPRPAHPISALGKLLIDGAKIEPHQTNEVSDNVRELRACVDATRARVGKIRCTAASGSSSAPPDGSKLVHFIRHGEGHHNVAQREWRAKDWDGKTEPYTLDNDPELKYVDAELNDKGRGQARDLTSRTEPDLQPQLLVVSPMRRATTTGLLAFAPHIARGTLPVLAHELCHERAGRHTCDKRLPRDELVKLYPEVDYSLLQEEEDPYWGDGVTREPWSTLAERAADFAIWLLEERKESHVAVAAHSAFLLAMFNAVLDSEDEAMRSWFGTGEMRTVLLTHEPQSDTHEQ